jgi:hypothetical protein
MGTAGVTDASLAGRLLLAASAISVVAFTGTPSAVAQPVATSTSDIIDGVEVDTCVGNPNANTVTGVPGVNVGFEFGLGVAYGFG